MRRISLGLGVGIVAVIGAIVGAQDPDHAPPGAATAPAVQTPAAPPAPQAPAGGQGAGRGRGAGAGPPAGAAPAAGGQGRGRGFDAAAIARAKPVYDAECGFCHGEDARGRADGPDLGRSLVVLGDTGGRELSGFLRVGRPDRGMPAFPALTSQQLTDIAEFLHQQFEAAKSRAAANPMASLVGDAQAGAAYFNGAGKCAGCHSPTGDLAHIAARYDPMALQDRLVNPRAGGRGQGGASPRSTRTVAVTTPNGQTTSGTLEYVSEFAVTLTQTDGTRRTFKREGEAPKVVITDPLKAHFDLLRTFRDKDMHDVTAYLWTLK